MHFIISPPQVNSTLSRYRLPSKLVLSPTTTGDVPPASTAFAAFNTLNQSVGTATTVVNTANLGPFSYSGSCTYDCGFQGMNWNTGTYDYTKWARPYFINALTRMDASKVFKGAFGAIKQWMTVLPTYTSKLTEAFNTIKQTDAAIVKAGGKVTPEQQQALSTAFTDALNQVQNSLAQVNTALQNMSHFITQQKPNSGSLQRDSSLVQSEVDTTITNKMNYLLSNVSCGHATITDQFNAIKTALNNAFASFQPSFATVNTNFDSALRDAEVIPGILLNLQTDSDTVTNSIKKAQGYPPTSPLRMLNINIATNNWKNLNTYVQSQLTT